MPPLVMQERIDFVGKRPDIMPPQGRRQRLQLCAAVSQAIGVARVIQRQHFLSARLAVTGDRRFQRFGGDAPTVGVGSLDANERMASQLGHVRIRHIGRRGQIDLSMFKCLHTIEQQRFAAGRDQDLLRVDCIAIGFAVKIGDAGAQFRQARHSRIVLAKGRFSQRLLHMARWGKWRLAKAKAVDCAPAPSQAPGFFIERQGARFGHGHKCHLRPRKNATIH